MLFRSEDSEASLATGHSVVADAVFARAAERAAIEAVGRSAGVETIGLWLDAPAQTLEDRVTARRDDASDADAAVVRHQLDYDLGDMRWHRIDASDGAGETLKRAMTRL